MKPRHALEGVKVVEFAWAAVGPLTGKYFSDHGATVIRVESHTSIDPLRNTAPFKDGVPGVDRSYWYPAYSTNKCSVSLNVNTAKGKEVALRLIQWADIVTEAYTPKNMRKWGLDYPSVRKVKPDIIYLSTCQQGQYGPNALARGYGNLASSVAGFFNLIGWPDRPPGLAFSPYSDYVNPRFGATALLAALDYRRRTGQGQYIDQSQFETTVHFLAPVIMNYAANGQMTSRNGNRNPEAAPHGAFPCADERWIAIAVTGEEEWRSFCRAIDRPELAAAPRFATLRARKEHEDELERVVGEWTSQHPAAEVERLLQAAGVPAGTVSDTRDVCNDPQLTARRHFRWLPHPVFGTIACESPAFRLSKTPCELRTAGPGLGEHNEYVYRDILGLTDDEIADMLVEGVITTEDDLPEMSAHA